MIEDYKLAIEIVKGILSVFKDIIVIMVLFILVVFPNQAFKALKNSDVEKGFEISLVKESNNITASARESAQQANNELSYYKKLVDSISHTTKDEVVKSQLENISTHLSSSLTGLKNININLNNALKKQEVFLKEKDALYTDAGAAKGWLLIGKTDEKKQRWLQTTVVDTSIVQKPQELDGNTIDIMDDTYLHNGSAEIKSNFTQLPICSAIEAGQQIVVQKTVFSNAVGGGWLVWVYF